MAAEQIFIIVRIGINALQYVLPVALMFLPKPHHALARASSAVLLAWVASVFYNIYIYNPAGIAAAIEQGIDSPEMQYDNNTIAVILIGGWFWPVISVGTFLLGNAIWCQITRKPNTLFKRDT